MIKNYNDENLETIIHYEGFSSVKELLYYLMKDDLSLKQIRDFTGLHQKALRIRITNYNLEKYMLPKGGPNNRRCSDQKWRLRARSLGFDNEREMLIYYQNDMVTLFNIINRKICFISPHGLFHRYKRKNLAIQKNYFKLVKNKIKIYRS